MGMIAAYTLMSLLAGFGLLALVSWLLKEAAMARYALIASGVTLVLLVVLFAIA